MIEAITSKNRHVYADALESMYRMRYRVLVDQCGWRLPDAVDGRDVDAFDTPEAVYLIERDPSDRHVTGCARLLPTTAPHMMTELFREACDLQDVPRGPDVWELSRFVVDDAHLGSYRAEVRARRRIGLGVTEFCLSAGIARLTWFTRQSFYNVALKIWDTQPLGRPREWPEDRAVYIPAVSVINESALRRQRARLAGVEDTLTFALMPVALANGPPHFINPQPEAPAWN